MNDKTSPGPSDEMRAMKHAQYQQSSAELIALAKQDRAWIAISEAELASEVSEHLVYEHATQLLALAKRWMAAELDKSSRCYAFVHQSPQRVRNVRAIASSARNAAKRFEHYMRHPEAYSLVDAALAFQHLMIKPRHDMVYTYLDMPCKTPCKSVFPQPKALKLFGTREMSPRRPLCSAVGLHGVLQGGGRYV